MEREKFEDRPPQEPHGGLLLGLFHGIPRTEKSVFYSSPPDRIFLYQRNIEAVCASEAEVRRQVRATLLHEVGHYFGLREDELRGGEGLNRSSVLHGSLSPAGQAVHRTGVVSRRNAIGCAIASTQGGTSEDPNPGIP